jgi:hypothetical protein
MCKGVLAVLLFCTFVLGKEKFKAVYGESCPQNDYQPNWSSLDTRPNPQWFSLKILKLITDRRYMDAKFGIFIHWGVKIHKNVLFSSITGLLCPLLGNSRSMLSRSARKSLRRMVLEPTR